MKETIQSTVTVSLLLPGKLVDVKQSATGTGIATVELPVLGVDGPMLTKEAIESLTKGMTDFDAEILLERIRHFAMTEQIRTRISVGGLVFKTWDKSVA